MYTLHGFFTQNSLKPLYVMEGVGADFRFQYVDLLKGENRTDEFRAMNPVGKAPVLEHDGEFLFESGAICRYVANVENSPLYPQEKLERARVDQWMDFFTCHLGQWLTTLYFQNIMKPKAGLGEPDAAACEEAIKFAHRQLKILERWLGNSEWLANDSLSIADLFAFAYMEQAGDVGFPLDDYPRVKAWVERLAGQDCVARAKARLPS